MKEEGKDMQWNQSINQPNQFNDAKWIDRQFAAYWKHFIQVQAETDKKYS